MQQLFKRLAVPGLIVIGLAFGLQASTASATTSTHASKPPAVSHRLSALAARVIPNCISHDGQCYYVGVGGTSTANPSLTVRSGPGTGYSAIGSLPDGQSGTAYCYSTGTDINGDVYWDWGHYNGTSGYVSDYYLYTGGNIYQQVGSC